MISAVLEQNTVYAPYFAQCFILSCLASPENTIHPFQIILSKDFVDNSTKMYLGCRLCLTEGSHFPYAYVEMNLISCSRYFLNLHFIEL